MNSRRLIRSPHRPLREASLEFPPGGLFTQTASPCGTFSQFQSGPKPQLAEFGNRAANRRIITATAAHKTSAMRSRRLIGANGQTILFPLSISFFARSIKAALCITAKTRDDVRYGSKAEFKRLRLMSALPPKADIGGASIDVRFVSKADIRHPFDHSSARNSALAHPVFGILRLRAAPIIPASAIIV